MKPILLVMALAAGFSVHAQTYKDSILQLRQHYKEEFITEERSPLKAEDTAYLRFYAPDKKFCVVASFATTPDAKAFNMPTHSGKTKLFQQYGLATFSINGKKCTLQVFQNLTILNNPKYKNHLFIPFTDATTYEETYGGGRYIDLETTDIKDNKLVIDFNKCYNPYCAYADGYNCPIPPVENRLAVAVKAGEKLFGKPHKD